MSYDCRWNVWIKIKGTLGQHFQMICPCEHHVRDGKYLLVMLAELVMSRTYFLPLILSCWMLSPPSNMQSPHFCAYTMHVLLFRGAGRELGDGVEAIWSKHWQQVSVVTVSSSWMFELLLKVHFAMNWRSLPCVSLPFNSSYIVCSIAHWACSGPRLRGDSCEMSEHFFECLCVRNAQLLQPCKYHKTCVRRSKQSMQDGGIERSRETGGRGRGQGEGACTVTESIKDEKGLGRSLKGLIK